VSVLSIYIIMSLTPRLRNLAVSHLCVNFKIIYLFVLVCVIVRKVATLRNTLV
jgi:hypothetical protein